MYLPRSVMTTQSLPVTEHLLRRGPVLDSSQMRAKDERQRQSMLRKRTDMQRMRDDIRERDDIKRRSVAERKALIENNWQEKVLAKFNTVEDRRLIVLERTPEKVSINISLYYSEPSGYYRVLIISNSGV